MLKKINKMKYLFLVIGVFIITMIITVYADEPHVVVVSDENCKMTAIEYGERNEGREIGVEINDVKAGKRLTDIKYCLASLDCEDENNWIALANYNSGNVVSALQNSVGSNDMYFNFLVPISDIKIKAYFADFEAMDISYAKYLLSTENREEYRDIYIDKAFDIENYESDFANIVTGYRGGDIILPNGCTDNGCMLKVTLTEADYNSIMARLNDYNENYNRDDEDKLFLDLGSMNNHLDDYNLAGDTLSYLEKNNKLYLENSDGKVSFYLIVSKFFYEKNRSDFTVADNKNRIISTEYIGLNYAVDKKYFDEGNNFGFLTFNEFNEYKSQTEIFYGAPKIKLSVDSVIEPALADGGSSAGMGTIKYPYNKIVSLDNDKYPIDDDFELSIKSFYEPEYVVPMSLMNDSELVRNVYLSLSRFAFGGNAGGLLLVDDKGINCRQAWNNPDCREDNIYISTDYRGLYDTFYSTGETSTIKAFEISSQWEGIEGRQLNNEIVYNRNLNFNPWAVAIFYKDDEVITTKSFDLGSLIKVEGFSEKKIENDQVNNIAYDNGQLITNYNSADYTVFGYGIGYEISMNEIKYFSRGSYERGNINYTLILASKEDILSNDINRIALFLTNGELKSDENNFPELTYGVGEGKMFYIDGRVFEELGGGE